MTAPALLEIWYELGRMATLPITAEELENVRQYAVGSLALSVSTQAGLGLHAVGADRRRARAGLAARASAAAGGGDAGGDVRGGADVPGAGRAMLAVVLGEAAEIAGPLAALGPVESA